MRLISLTANKESFHPVTFNRTGISLIVGQQKDARSKSKSRTYNGVGKSLLIELVHFCLGSNRNKEFESKIPGWQFILRLESKGVEYRISRATSDQNKLNVNGAEYSLVDFKALFEPKAFTIKNPAPNLAFRPLIKYFMRPGPESYISFDQTDSQSTPYAKLVNVAFLLGLDVSLIANKHELRKEKEQVREMKSSLSKDKIFHEYFTGNKNPDIELRDLEVKVKRLKSSLETFKIADDYHQKQKEANLVQRDVQAIRNEIVVVKNAITSIDQSMQIRPDLSASAIAEMYEEANSSLPDIVVKRLSDVEAFHKKLIANRSERLKAEKAKFEAELKELEGKLSSANTTLDDLNGFLGEHGAFDEYTSLTQELQVLEASAQKLRDYKGLLATYSNKTQEITALQSEQTILANKYLTDNKELLDSNLDAFRSFSIRFYGDRPGGLTVTNNEEDNQTRFNIEAHIEDDKSDGINEVKIFCFDMTVLSQKHNHNVNFLFHDSRLFSPVDMRQRATAFKIANNVCSNQQLQYIATLNEDLIESMKDQFTPEEFEALITKATVLRLTDESPADKLLGIEVDMKY